MTSVTPEGRGQQEEGEEVGWWSVLGPLTGGPYVACQI